MANASDVMIRPPPFNSPHGTLTRAEQVGKLCLAACNRLIDELCADGPQVVGGHHSIPLKFDVPW
jgi:hypothetical protein